MLNYLDILFGFVAALILRIDTLASEYSWIRYFGDLFDSRFSNMSLMNTLSSLHRIPA